MSYKPLPTEGNLDYLRAQRRIPSRLKLDPADGRLVLAHMAVAFVALLLGGIAGLLQALARGGSVELPSWINYYQLLTAHGVLMALVFTTFFIFGFLYSGIALTLGPELLPGTRGLGWISFWLMTIGGAVATVPIIQNKASVLYTFYAPMQAAPAFYIGLTLVVVGSWIGGWAIFMEYRWWRVRTRAAISPLFAYMAITTLLVWQIATLGVAAEMLLQLIPWSLDWAPTINVLLSRTLFWFFGHPLVYFWLMPAYLAWYLCMPRLIGGEVFSDSIARMSFLLLLVLSIPVGLHHQLMEPGIETGWKVVQVGLTLAVVLPSLMTAFAMFATMERAGRARGYGGLLGWLRGLPWKDARFLALFMGMLMFVPGGIGGVINASYELDALVHNTLWITGHFHLTVATAVALTFIGVAFWLVPHAAGRLYTPTANRVALVQVWLWVIGMTVMSGAMHLVGLLHGQPRRTAHVEYDAADSITSSWQGYDIAMAVGGTILFASLVIAVGLVAHLALRAPRGDSDYVIADPPRESVLMPRIVEHWRVWMGAVAVLVIAAYAAPIWHVVSMAPPGSKPFAAYAKNKSEAKTARHKPEEEANADKTTPATATDLTSPQLDAARDLFSQSCGSCHTLAEAKTTGTAGPNLDDLDITPENVLAQIQNGGNTMPPSILTGKDAELVAQYIAQQTS